MGALEDVVEHLDRIASSMERIERFLVERESTERIVAEEAGTRGVETDEPPASTPPSTQPPPARDHVEAKVVRHGDVGSAHGVSNMRFAAYAPKILRRLLRDDRAIQTGVLTSTLDQEIPISRESRTRVVKRMVIECGFVSLSAAAHGVAPYVRVTDVEAARRWLIAFGNAEHTEDVNQERGGA